jgi:hypothetical protein
MPHFDLESYDYTPTRSGRFMPILIGTTLLLSISFWYAYSNGLIPTFTFVIEEGRISFQRDDFMPQPNPTSVPAEHKVVHIYKINDRVVSKSEFDAFNQEQAPAVEAQPNIVVATSAPRVPVYPSVPPTVEPESKSRVLVMGGSSSSIKSSECSSIESQRDYIRSQQRINSTQYLRDQYTYWTKRKNEFNC